MNFLKKISFKGKKVLYRVDINSNIAGGKILDDLRIKSIIPTVEWLLKDGAKQIIFLAHQGRGRERSPETVLDLHAKFLGELLGQKVLKYDSCRDLKIPEDAQLVMLENVRLDDEADPDKKKREAFAKVLAEYGDVYVNDAFAACHRDHATISSLPKLMKEKACGLLLEKEMRALKPLMKGEVEQPFTIIIGGAKIDTKIGLIQNFSNKVGEILLGGGIANTFLAAEGFDVGASLKEEDKMILAQEIALTLDKRLFLPTDVVVADEIGQDAESVDLPVEDVMGEMMILDIGAQTAKKYSEIIAASRTVIWNGPMGAAEYAPFRKGSEAIALAMMKSDATTIVGGGESVAVINALSIPHKNFSHVSTGGGAMLEFLGGKTLPGIEALQ